MERHVFGRAALELMLSARSRALDEQSGEGLYVYLPKAGSDGATTVAASGERLAGIEREQKL